MPDTETGATVQRPQLAEFVDRNAGKVYMKCSPPAPQQQAGKGPLGRKNTTKKSDTTTTKFQRKTKGQQLKGKISERVPDREPLRGKSASERVSETVSERVSEREGFQKRVSEVFRGFQRFS